MKNLITAFSTQVIKAAQGASAATAGAISALWTFPSILAGSFVIAWAAEAGQFLVSQGMALAILAWLQTLPEFAVEAVIAWEAGKDPEKIHLVTANFTGSLRLLTGLGWPMIYFVAAFFNRRKNGGIKLKKIRLEDEHSVEVVSLIIPILYFFYIYYKATLTIVDSIILTCLYIAYIWLLNKIPPKDAESEEEMGYIPRKILALPETQKKLAVAGLFLLGGVIIYLVAEPFFHSMLALSVTLGISNFIFIQWVAPFLSEFPEKLSAFYWAKRIVHAPMALMNMVSSNINQWTVLVAMIPIVFGMSSGWEESIRFDQHQQAEILLTISQSLMGFCFLVNMVFHWYEAVTIFILWLAQFLIPNLREEITIINFVASVAALLIAGKRGNMFSAFGIFRAVARKHFRKKKIAH